MNHPLFRLPVFVLYLSVLVFLCISSIFFFTRTFSLDTANVVADSAVSWFIFLWLGIGFWYPAKFMTLDDSSIGSILVKHLLAALTASGIWMAAVYTLLVYFLGISGNYRNIIDSSLHWRFAAGVVLYIMAVLLYYLYIYYSNFQSKLVKESELRVLVREAELKTLKYQINPHFIFNSLNSISSLTMINADKAREMTVMLSNYLRFTLAESEKTMNPLIEELKNCRLYLEIEKIRFENKFEYTEDIDSECLQVQVPSMLLQPLFENAIKHGVYEALEKINIIMSCRCEKDYLKISLANDYDPDAERRKGERIGLNNIRDRLRLIYNQNDLISIEREGKVFRVNIFIPKDK